MGTLVLGVDGLGLEGLNALVKFGYMREAKSFVKRYSVADSIRTIFPPQTIPVWPSMFSGVNPGKHGVFSFFNSQKGRINTRLDVRFPYIHEVFALNNRRVLVDGVPLSYPPLTVNGVYITDWLATRNRIMVKHKKKSILLDMLSEYKHVDPTLKRKSWRLFVRKAVDALERRRWVLTGILEGEYIDDAFVVVSELDWIFHSFYHLVVEGRPPKFLKPLLRAINKFVSAILRIGLKKFDNVVIIADHGFHVYRKIIFINEVLRRMKLCGGLELKLVGGNKVRHINTRANFKKFVHLGICNLAIRAKFALVSPNRIYKKIIKQGIRPLPSPHKSLAFAMLNMPAMFILVNPKIAHREKLLNRLIDSLKKVRYDGKKILGFVANRNDIFSGPYTRYAPHIGIFGNIKNDIYLSPLLMGLIALDKIVNYHDFEPIFALKSKTDEIAKTRSSTILDLAPTLYALEGIPAPRGLDGFNLSKIELNFKDYMRIARIRRKILLRKGS